MLIEDKDAIVYDRTIASPNSDQPSMSQSKSGYPGRVWKSPDHSGNPFIDMDHSIAELAIKEDGYIDAGA